MGPCGVSLLQSLVRSSHGTMPVPVVQYLQECKLMRVTHSIHERRQNFECHCSIQSVDVHVVIAKLCVPLENLTKLLRNSPRLPLSTPSHQPPNLLYIHRVRGLRCVCMCVCCVCGGGGGG